MLKRLFDILAASFGLLLLSPVILIVAWQVRRKLGSPVFFRQTRPGLNGKPFEMVKFRTMRDAFDGDGKPLPDSERITPFGRFLRSTSLSFAGGGVYAPKIEELAGKHSQVSYHGYVKPSSANRLVAEHRWAILPIDDEVTKYAFPSKSSSYLASGCRILAICGKDTAVAYY